MWSKKGTYYHKTYYRESGIRTASYVPSPFKAAFVSGILKVYYLFYELVYKNLTLKDVSKQLHQ